MLWNAVCCKKESRDASPVRDGLWTTILRPAWRCYYKVYKAKASRISKSSLVVNLNLFRQYIFTQTIYKIRCTGISLKYIHSNSSNFKTASWWCFTAAPHVLLSVPPKPWALSDLKGIKQLFVRCPSGNHIYISSATRCRKHSIRKLLTYRKNLGLGHRKTNQNRRDVWGLSKQQKDRDHKYVS